MYGNDTHEKEDASPASHDSMLRLLYLGTDASIGHGKPRVDRTRLHGRTLAADWATVLSQRVHAEMKLEQQAEAFGIGDESIVGQDLSGGCCITAAIVAIVCDAYGISTTILGGHPRTLLPMHVAHWWVETACGWAIDPTWGQFSEDTPFAGRSNDHVIVRQCMAPAEFIRLRGSVWPPAAKTLPSYHMPTIRRIVARILGGDA